MSGRARLVFIAAAAVALAAAASFVNTIPPAVPAAAAASPLGRTTGGNTNGCFERLVRDKGWIDACWATHRVAEEADPQKDYYVLKLFATYESLRWAVFKTDLVGEPGSGVYSMWPDFDLGATCWSGSVDLGPVPDPPVETICGPMRVEQDDAAWVETVTWTCHSCLLANSDTTSISLYDAIGVPEGSVPAWDLFADGG